MPKALPEIIPLSQLFDEGAYEIRVGRRQGDADVVVPLVTLAPVHASFYKTDGVVEIHDTKDEYPTYVNNCLVTKNRRLDDGSCVLMGGISYLYKDGNLYLQQVNAGSSVHLVNVSFGFRMGKEKLPVLSCLTQSIRSGESVVIRGESGCGKSTLLKVIADLYHMDAKTSGFWVAGDFQISSPESSVVAYVPQDPVLPEGLTVLEVFRLFAGIYGVKNPKEQINYILCTLGLVAKEKRNNRVERLSGGERRRVHVGIELLRKPTLLLIDEPDSNLDKINRQRILLHLVALKHSGVTVIATSHSPESEAYFDRAIDLERTGGGAA